MLCHAPRGPTPFFIALVFSTLAFSPIVPADEKHPEESLEDIVVRPLPSSSAPKGDRASPTLTIDKPSLEKNRTSIVPALEGSVGISVSHYGGMQDASAISVRGSKPEQVNIYLDGIPLQGGAGSVFSLGDIPPSLLDAVEVTKGFSPPSQAQSAIGGTVALNTPSINAGNHLRMGGGYGSFNTITGDIKASFGDASGVGLLGGYRFLKTDGNFSFIDDGGTPLRADDDRDVTRQNNQSQAHTGLLKGTVPLGSTAVVSAENLFFQKGQGIPSLGSAAESHASLTALGNHAEFDLGVLLPWKAVRTTDLTGFVSFERQHYFDELGEIGLGLQRTETTTWRYGLDNAWELSAGESHDIKAGWHVSQDLYLPYNSLASDPSGATSRREIVSVWVGDAWSLGDGRVHLFPSLRSEHILNHLAGRDPTLSGFVPAPDNGTDYHPVSGRFGAAWEVVTPLLLAANFSRNSRPPSFSELYGDRGLVQGNPELSPESSWNWDAGAHWNRQWGRGAQFFLNGAYFENRTSDLIQFIQTSQRTARAENISSSLARGIEIGTQCVLGSWASASVDYTYQVVRNTSDLPGVTGKILPGHPRHEVKLTADVTWRAIRPFATLQYLDGNFLDTQNLFETEHRWLVGAGVSWKFLKNFEARFEGRNLIDDRVVDVLGFPLPGRSFFGELTYDI